MHAWAEVRHLLQSRAEVRHLLQSRAEVRHLLQSSKSPLTGFLCSVDWRIIVQTRLSTNTPRTPTVFNSAILRNNYISLLSDLCACIHVKKNGVVKEAIVLQWVVRITSCDFKPGKKRWAGALLSEKCCCFCMKTIVKESRKFELARLKKKKKKKKENILAVRWLSGLVLSQCFLAPLVVFCHENTRRWMVECYNGL